jgi:hypothetical protein
MAQRYDLLTAREYGDGKTAWTRVGVAFENRDGNGFSLQFEALPLPSIDRDGKLQVRVLMRVPRDRDDAPPERAPRPPARAAPPPRDTLGLDDSEIPF